MPSALQRPLLSRESTTAAERLLGVGEADGEYSVSGVTTWEQPDDGTREATEMGFGVKFLKHHSNSHADKVLEYETRQLEARPWAIILEETRRASVLAMPHVLRSMIRCSIIAIIFMGLSLLLEEEVMEVITSANLTVSGGLFFLLGPYVGLCIARWWQMRTEFLGGTWGAIADLNLYASIWFNSGSKADVAARALVQRYGLLAHFLLYKDARGQSSLDDAVGKGLLLPHEATLLEPLPSRSQMVFTWLSDFFNRALAEDGPQLLGTSPVAHAQMQAPVVIKRCLDGRGAAGGALALVYTQLPFPYVHLLSMLVQVACVVNAMVQGARTGWILSTPTCLGDAKLAEGTHHYRFELQEGCPPALFVYHFTASTLILGGLVVSILIYPIIYHGLLSIGVMLSNPLSTDLIDFPGSFYQSVMKAELNGFAKSADAVDLGGTGRSSKGPRWWPGLAPRV